MELAYPRENHYVEKIFFFRLDRAFPPAETRSGYRFIRNVMVDLLFQGRCCCPRVREIAVALLTMQFRGDFCSAPLEFAVRANENMILAII